MSEHLGYVVWRRNSAKWETLYSFAPGERDRAEVTAREHQQNEADYDGPSDLLYEYGVSAVNR